MSIERNLIISVLKLTKEGPVLTENVKRDARLPSATTRKLLKKLQNEGLVYLKTDSIEADSNIRLRLAIKATSLGADIEHVGNLLCWQEFEEIAALALRNYGYSVTNNLRFKNASHKWEIDVVGSKKPLVVCIDCKHWQHAISPSVLKRIVDAQVERTRALADSLPNISLKLEFTQWSNATFIPFIISLIPNSFKFYNSVPIVPIFQLQDFLNQLPAYAGSLKFFTKTFSSLSQNF
ncbi:MAG: restriction endonuclease [Candidatus Bathyarchaeia archaeon]|jgi:Holliday junction resolvase-like predicted endonuclease